MDQLSKKLLHSIELEGEKSHEEIAGFIVGELIGDYEDSYRGLLEKDPSVRHIADIASDLEWSNGSRDQLDRMWSEMRSLIEGLSSKSR